LNAVAKGEFRGERLWCEINPGSRDWMLTRSSRHLIDPGRYYFRTTPVFETGAPEYAWLNAIVAVGSGRLIEAGGVAYDVFELL
jgi:Protein of unknown function (DUF3237)